MQEIAEEILEEIAAGIRYRDDKREDVIKEIVAILEDHFDKPKD